MACRRIAGVAYVFIDGRQYPLRGNLTVSADTIEREGVAGQDAVHGFIERPRVPWIEGDFSDIGGLSLMALQAMCDVTVTAELANGKQYILRNAWTSTAREFNAADGQATVRWEGMASEELMA
jgi:Phage tail tube protein